MGNVIKNNWPVMVEAGVEEGVDTVFGLRIIRQFIRVLFRPCVLRQKLEADYENMSEDGTREAEALEWAEAMVVDSFEAPQ